MLFYAAFFLQSSRALLFLTARPLLPLTRRGPLCDGDVTIVRTRRCGCGYRIRRRSNQDANSGAEDGGSEGGKEARATRLNRPRRPCPHRVSRPRRSII